MTLAHGMRVTLKWLSPRRWCQISQKILHSTSPSSPQLAWTSLHPIAVSICHGCNNEHCCFLQQHPVRQPWCPRHPHACQGNEHPVSTDVRKTFLFIAGLNQTWVRGSLLLSQGEGVVHHNTIDNRQMPATWSWRATSYFVRQWPSHTYVISFLQTILVNHPIYLIKSTLTRFKRQTRTCGPHSENRSLTDVWLSGRVLLSWPNHSMQASSSDLGSHWQSWNYFHPAKTQLSLFLFPSAMPKEGFITFSLARALKVVSSDSQLTTRQQTELGTHLLQGLKDEAVHVNLGARCPVLWPGDCASSLKTKPRSPRTENTGITHLLHQWDAASNTGRNLETPGSLISTCLLLQCHRNCSSAYGSALEWRHPNSADSKNEWKCKSREGGRLLRELNHWENSGRKKPAGC